MNGITINNISSNDVDILILKNKYKLLDKIGEDKLEFVIDEIFELGYSMYMKNFIKTDLINEFQSYQNQNQNQNQNNLIKPINTIT